jgi:uncharacterized protein YjbJ (UPF0337 family)
MDVNQNKAKSNPAFKVSGNWENQSKELKGKFSQLTDSDLKFETGKENELLERVEKRLNKNRDEVITIINNAQTEKV